MIGLWAKLDIFTIPPPLLAIQEPSEPRVVIRRWIHRVDQHRQYHPGEPSKLEPLRPQRQAHQVGKSDIFGRFVCSKGTPFLSAGKTKSAATPSISPGIVFKLIAFNLFIPFAFIYRFHHWWRRRRRRRDFESYRNGALLMSLFAWYTVILGRIVHFLAGFQVWFL